MTNIFSTLWEWFLAFMNACSEVWTWLITPITIFGWSIAPIYLLLVGSAVSYITLGILRAITGVL